MYKNTVCFENMRYTIEVKRLVKDMQNILNAEYYYIKLLINDYEFCEKLHILRASVKKCTVKTTNY